jgi:tRNA1(Val) A37 N6-methylase TrmN6
VEKILSPNGAMLFFHRDDPQALKEIISYLKNYNFKIYMKWVIVNSLPLASFEVPSLKV